MCGEEWFCGLEGSFCCLYSVISGCLCFFHGGQTISRTLCIRSGRHRGAAARHAYQSTRLSSPNVGRRGDEKGAVLHPRFVHMSKLQLDCLHSRKELRLSGRPVYVRAHHSPFFMARSREKDDKVVACIFDLLTVVFVGEVLPGSGRSHWWAMLRHGYYVTSMDTMATAIVHLFIRTGGILLTGETTTYTTCILRISHLRNVAYGTMRSSYVHSVVLSPVFSSTVLFVEDQQQGEVQKSSIRRRRTIVKSCKDAGPQSPMLLWSGAYIDGVFGGRRGDSRRGRLTQQYLRPEL